MRRLIGAGLCGLRNVFVAIGALFFAGSVLVLANYASTQGVGTTFGSIVIGGVHFASMLLCDATTANQCATVNSSGQVAMSTASGANVVLGALNDAATCAAGNTEMACLRQIDADVKAPAAISTWGSGTLGAMANYGTSPGAVLVPGANVFLTNTPPVSQSGTWTVQPGNTANTTPWLTTPSAGSASGATPSFVVAANSNNSTNLKGSAGTVYSIQTSNINATTAYFIKLYDKATAPTCGTDTPVGGYVIPAANGGNNVTVMVGKKFTLGIGYCIVAGIANNDNTSVPAATILTNIDWN